MKPCSARIGNTEDFAYCSEEASRRRRKQDAGLYPFRNSADDKLYSKRHIYFIVSVIYSKVYSECNILQYIKTPVIIFIAFHLEESDLIVTREMQ